MNIGVDIDGVLNNSRKWEVEVATKYFEKKGKLLKNLNAYFLSDMFGVSEKEELLFWDETIFEYAKDVEVREFASEETHKLKSEGHKIVIITARSFANENNNKGKKMREYVKNWLTKNKIYYDEIVYSGEDKVHSVLENNIDVMIEDSPRNIESISKIIPVICFDNIYNTDVSGKNIFRAYSWKDVDGLIKTINK